MSFFFRAFVVTILVSEPVVCAALNLPAEAPHPKVVSLSDRMRLVRSQMSSIEQALIGGLKEQTQARANIQRLKKLIELQEEERSLGQKRAQELEQAVGDLEVRRGILREKMTVQTRAIRKALKDLDRSLHEQPQTVRLPEREKLEAPRRQVLSRLVDRHLKEIEVYKADLEDADRLESKVREEKSQLEYLGQELLEQNSLMELSRNLQLDLLKKRQADRIQQLEQYRKLKGVESQVERLMGEFHARKELERAQDVEKQANRAMKDGKIAQLQGRLPLPIRGRVLSNFGRQLDSQSGLYVFKKGIEIESLAGQPVKSVSSGKVVFSGELAGYGRVSIVDHGGQVYSLCAKMGSLQKKTGDFVQQGDVIGLSDASGKPVYFEIRSRNVAVNPLQWVAN